MQNKGLIASTVIIVAVVIATGLGVDFYFKNKVDSVVNSIQQYIGKIPQPAPTPKPGSTTTIVNNGTKTIFAQGVATSGTDPLPGHSAHQAILILPPKADGTVYEGTLTFTATTKVEVVVLQAVNNKDLQYDTGTYGTLLTAPLTGNLSAGIHLITPDYGTSPVASTSIHFVGNALALHTLSGQKFAAEYSVAYTTSK